MSKDQSQSGGDPAGGDRIVDPDALLVERARTGDREALGALLTGHEQMIFAVCLRTLGNRESARDMTQDAMVKAISALDSFDGRSRFSTWLTRIAINACLSHLRKQRLRKHASLDAPMGGSWGGAGGSGGRADSAGQRIGQTLPGGEPEPGSRIEADETLACLDRAMARMDPEQRVLLSLRDVRGLDYSRIADALGVPVGTVKSRLFRARAALREAMEEAQAESDSVGDGHRMGPIGGPEKEFGSGGGGRGERGSAGDEPDASPGRSLA